VLFVAVVVEGSVLVFVGVEVPFGASPEVLPMGLVPFGETEAAFALKPLLINDHPPDNNKSEVGWQLVLASCLRTWIRNSRKMIALRFFKTLVRFPEL